MPKLVYNTPHSSFLRERQGEMVRLPDMRNMKEFYFAYHMIEDEEMKSHVGEILDEFIDVLTLRQEEDLTTIHIALLLRQGRDAALWRFTEEDSIPYWEDPPEHVVDGIAIFLIRSMYYAPHQNRTMDEISRHYMSPPEDEDIVVKEK